MGTLVRMIDKNATLTALVVDSTDIVARAEQIHHTSAVATAALGRLLTGASLMGMMMKNHQDTLTLRVSGGGPLGTAMAVSDYMGNVRGYVSEPIVELPLNDKGKLDVGGAVGTNGLLYVTKDIGGKEPYNGCVPLVSGEIAEDITRYYAESEQVPTVCALGVLVAPDLTVQAAGGLLIQLLPFCPEETISQLEKNMANLPPMTTMLDQGMTVHEIAALALEGFEYEELDNASPEYRCYCTQDRVEKALLALPEQDRQALPNEEGRFEVTCRFCDKVYSFDRSFFGVDKPKKKC